MSNNNPRAKLKKLQMEEKVLRKLIDLLSDQIRSVSTERLYLQYHSSDNPTEMTSSQSSSETVNQPATTSENTLNLEVDKTLESYKRSVNRDDQEIEED